MLTSWHNPPYGYACQAYVAVEDVLKVTSKTLAASAADVRSPRPDVCSAVRLRNDVFGELHVLCCDRALQFGLGFICGQEGQGWLLPCLGAS